MAVKIVSKSKLKFIDGQFYKKDKLVAINPVVVEQLNHFEKVLQQYSYIQSQPEYQPAPSLENWEFKSALKSSTKLHLVVKTPTLDAEYEKAKNIMHELDAMSDVNVANEAFTRYSELLYWLDQRNIMIDTDPKSIPEAVDTMHLGNPLVLHRNDIIDAIVKMSTGAERDEEAPSND